MPLPPRLPPRLRALPPPKPAVDPDVVYGALAALETRLTSVESRLAGLFKKSMVTIVAVDFLVGLAKVILEAFAK